MSSLAYPRKAARRLSRGGLAAFVGDHAPEIILAVPIAILAVVALTQLPREFDVDTWLELVTGRLIWQSGIPHHETLTAMSYGIGWVDQQWLAQLASYAIDLVGGFALLGVINVGLLISGVVMATVYTRRLGATFRSTLIVLPLALAMIEPSREVRTQMFAIPLFMLIVYLVTQDSRHQSRRVFWCLPILVLWANVHGTVTMGAMLVALYGLTCLWDQRANLRNSAAAWKRPVALIAGSLVSIMITPYGTSIIGYYRLTMVSSNLRHAVTEWQPITSEPATAAFLFAFCALAIWSFGRNPSKTTLWEKVAFLALAASAITVCRNALFFGLFALMVVPLSLAWGDAKTERRSDPVRTAINGSIGLLAIGAVVVAVIATFVRPVSAIEYRYQRPQVLNTVERVTRADPSIRVIADQRFDDWLLWRDPALSGRVAFDVRFEILTTSQLGSLEALFGEVGRNWEKAARGYRLLVLDKKYDQDAVASFSQEPGSRIVYNDGERVVILRAASQAARG